MLILIANGEPPPLPLLHTLSQKSEGVCAIDGGLATCDRAKIVPDLIMGDLDSIPPDLLEKYAHVPVIEMLDQTKTDLEKAVEYLIDFGIDSLTVCGALGKRIDHTLTNICLLSRYPGKLIFDSEEELCFALPKSYTLTCKKGQQLSLIPVSAKVFGVSSNGLKWELNHETLSREFVSISNESMQEHVTITFEKGDLLVTLNKCMIS